MLLSQLFTTIAILSHLGATDSFTPNPGHTVNLYELLTLVLTLYLQNPYLYLPEEPTSLVKGTDRIKVHVPFPKTMMMWDLTGYFHAPKLGVYIFEIEETAVATIKITKAYTGNESIQDALTFSYGPRRFELEKDTSYRIHIKYVGTINPLKILLTIPKGGKLLLHDVIMTEADISINQTEDCDPPRRSTSIVSTATQQSNEHYQKEVPESYISQTNTTSLTGCENSEVQEQPHSKLDTGNIPAGADSSFSPHDQTTPHEHSSNFDSFEITGSKTQDSTTSYEHRSSVPILTMSFNDISAETPHMDIFLPESGTSDDLTQLHKPTPGVKDDIVKDMESNIPDPSILEQTSQNVPALDRIIREYEIPDSSKMSLSKRGPAAVKNFTDEGDIGEGKSNHMTAKDSHEVSAGTEVKADRGFHYRLYLVLDENTPHEFLFQRSKLFSLEEGYLDSTLAKPRAIEFKVPKAVEISGYFDVPVNGIYLISKCKQALAAVQVGPGYPEKSPVHEYTIGNQWRIFDTRVSEVLHLELQAGIFYPFRIVSLTDKENLAGVFTQIGPDQQNIDLFQLWDSDSTAERKNDYSDKTALAQLQDKTNNQENNTDEKSRFTTYHNSNPETANTSGCLDESHEKSKMDCGNAIPRSDQPRCLDSKDTIHGAHVGQSLGHINLSDNIKLLVPPTSSHRERKDCDIHHSPQGDSGTKINKYDFTGASLDRSELWVKKSEQEKLISEVTKESGVIDDTILGLPKSMPSNSIDGVLRFLKLDGKSSGTIEESLPQSGERVHRSPLTQMVNPSGPEALNFDDVDFEFPLDPSNELDLVSTLPGQLFSSISIARPDPGAEVPHSRYLLLDDFPRLSALESSKMLDISEEARDRIPDQPGRTGIFPEYYSRDDHDQKPKIPFDFSDGYVNTTLLPSLFGSESEDGDNDFIWDEIRSRPPRASSSYDGLESDFLDFDPFSDGLIPGYESCALRLSFPWFSVLSFVIQFLV